MRSAARLAFAVMAIASLASFAESFTYEIHALDAGERRIVARGTKEYSIRDTTVTELTGLGQKFLQKELSLGNGFAVGLSDHREAELTGFGCWLRRKPSAVEADQYPGFSWEWFNRSGPATFDKLQGGGRIRVTTKSVAGAALIVRVEFLDDIVFRMNADPHGKPGEKTHWMTIRKGSVLAFPPEAPSKDATSAGTTPPASVPAAPAA